MDEQNLNVVDATQENVVDSQTNAENATVEQAQTTESVEKVEVAEQPQVEEKPTQTAEDNAKYAAIRREAEQKAYTKAQDELIASIYGESHGLYTKKQYDEAVKKAEEEQRKAALKEQGIDPSIVEDYVNNNPVVKKAQELIQKQEKEAFANKDNLDFLEYFQRENNRPFDAAKDTIPNEVWEMVQAYRETQGKEGKSLTDAYAKYELSVFRNKLAEYEKGSKTQQINATNAESSTGSVTGNGQSSDGSISFETFEANKNDQNWIKKNFNKIMESRAKW